MGGDSLTSLADCFRSFAPVAAAQESPFYERLSMHVAGDDALLRIASHAPREPVPNVFFGAVHYLLLKGAPHELREYYASVTEKPRNDDLLGKSFSDFCVQYKDTLIELIQSRLVQTNEVNRCAVLAPAFSLVYEVAGRRPLALVEIGASAGLNLLWDRYQIRYSDGTELGDAGSQVRIECEVRDGALPQESLPRPVVADRVGLDLNPIDLDDSEERWWLRALVWPDHRQRAKRLEAAMDVARQHKLSVLRGDALSTLPDLLSDVPRDLALCTYHSSVLYQFSADQRSAFAALLASAAGARQLWQVSAESEEGLKLLSFRDGRLVDERRLADFDAHGRWLRWHAD